MARRTRIRRRNRITTLALGLAAAAIVASGAQAMILDEGTGVPNVSSQAPSSYQAYQHSLGIGTAPDSGPVGAYQHSLGIGTAPDSGPVVAYQHSPGLGTMPADATPITSGTGFDWGDAGVGLATGFGVALLAAGAFVLTRRTRRGHSASPAAAA